MENLPLQEYGVAIVAVIAMVWIVRAFLKHLKEKDASFTTVIQNHINHSTAVQEKLTASNQKLIDVIERKL